jgi:ATP-binding cassette subfamily B (MDR/TAP) protein 1
MQLIMRFYDPDNGFITIDNVNLRDIDLCWLREVIGYVGQEPVLFATSIRENLLFANDKATDEQLE